MAVIHASITAVYLKEINQNDTVSQQDIEGDDRDESFLWPMLVVIIIIIIKLIIIIII